MDVITVVTEAGRDMGTRSGKQVDVMLTVVEAYATQTAARGAAILTVDALDMLLVAGLVLLLLRQVMPIAARLGGGVALASFGVASGALGRGAAVGGAASRRMGGGLACAGRRLWPRRPPARWSVA